MASQLTTGDEHHVVESAAGAAVVTVEVDSLGADHVHFLITAGNAEVLAAATIEFSHDGAAGWIAATDAGMNVTASNALVPLNAGGAVVTALRGSTLKGVLTIPWKKARLKLTVGANPITDLRVEKVVARDGHISAGG